MNQNTKNIFVNFKLELATGEKVYSKVYITEKSYGIARARLKKAGFDVDTQELSDIEADPSLLAGNEVLVDVTEEEYNGKPVTRCEIVTDRPKVDKGILSRATEGLRSIKRHEDDADASPAVAHVSKAKRKQLNEEAEAEGIPF